MGVLGINTHHPLRTAFIGTYLPRECGIATFTSDLCENTAALAEEDSSVVAVALTEPGGKYVYPPRVKMQIRQEEPSDYVRAAAFLESSGVDVICLQHEYGIFGGEEGSRILDLIDKVDIPLVVTCHTVFKDPEPLHKEIIREIADKADKLVVMSARAIDYLSEIYGVDRSKLVLIPHGVHDVPFTERKFHKRKFGVAGDVILTFGLLHRTKGIEYMIEAMPAIVSRHPQAKYIVLGATHPRVVAMEGESYRESLKERVRRYGLEKNVLFIPEFLQLNDLLEYLAETDIFVTPYTKLEYITSGALSYAMSAGAAVVSTPYWYAEEMLADGRGRLVPRFDSAALAREIIDLLDDREELRRMRYRAYAHTREMIWPRVARAYMELFREVVKVRPKVVQAVSGEASRAGKGVPGRRR
jgi:glycosyltransferase involved in cell wall biosynthesis